MQGHHPACYRAGQKLDKAAEHAFGATFFFLPLSKPLLFISLAVALLLFLASGGFFRALRHWRPLPWVAPAVVLAFLPLLSLLIHDFPSSQSLNLKLSYYWLFAFIVFLAAGQMRIMGWIQALLWGIGLLFTHAQLVLLGWWNGAPAPSASANYILYSQFLAVGIVLLSILYRHESGARRKTGYLLAMMLLFYGVATCAGRTGMLIVVVLLPFIFNNVLGRQSIVKVALGCGLALAVLLTSPMVQKRIDAAVDDIRLFKSDVTQTSIGFRLEMWETALGVFQAHPLTGAGTGGFTAAWRAAYRNDVAFVEPHNAFLFYAASYGALGLGALLWLYAAMLWTGWKERHSLAGGVVFAFSVICIVSSITNTLFMGAVSLAWVMLFIGLQGGLLSASPALAPIPDNKAVPA